MSSSLAVATRAGMLVIGLLLFPAAASAQLSRDPLTNLLLRQAAGIPTMGDLLAELGDATRNLAERVGEVTAHVRGARGEFWRLHREGKMSPDAVLAFEKALRTKDLAYLGMTLGNSSLLAALIARPVIDGGIPLAARPAFIAWYLEVNQNLSIDGSVASMFRAGAAMQADPAAARAQLDKADSTYRKYALRRFLDEYRQAGVTPPDLDAEAWRIALLGVRTIEQGDWITEPADPYGQASAAVAAGMGFPTRCHADLPQILTPLTPKADACGCLSRLFAETLRLEEQWTLETRFSPTVFLTSAISKVGLVDKVGACVR